MSNTALQSRSWRSRYAESVIIGYDFRKFDELVMPLSSAEIVYPPGAAVAKKNQKVEGQVTRILVPGADLEARHWTCPAPCSRRGDGRAGGLTEPSELGTSKLEL
jgi:hypothetical protein